MLTVPEHWDEVKALFQQALDLESPQRAAFLLENATSVEVRVAVEKLLSEHDSADGFLSNPVLIELAKKSGPSLQFKAGEVISNRFRIIRFVAAGGMGVVYEAEDLKLGRHVALKFLPEALASDRAARQRFQHEARAASALSHPNICTIYEIGDAQGLSYLAMELLQGRSLKHVIASRQLKTDQFIDFGIQIADGLDEAHRKGIIHRDIKPANIFITDRGQLKILDFGIAKFIQARNSGSEQPGLSIENSTETSLTRPGSAIGTVSYMSPEQVRGEPLDSRADLFSFGVVLYEMATGCLPFRGETQGVIFEGILRRNPPAPVRLNPELSPDLERIILKSLEKDREVRYQNASDIRADLKRSQRDSKLISDVAPGERTKPKLSGIISQLPRRTGAKVTLSPAFYVIPFLTAVTVALLLLTPAFRSQTPPTYRQITFRKGCVVGARFAPDGQTVVYEAKWERDPTKLFTVRTDGTDVRVLDLPSSRLQSVSSSGELATTLIDKATSPSNMRLARTPMTGGSPRELVDHIRSADWSPDGTQLAVSRYKDGKCRLEYPIGKVLYENLGMITDIRISPLGDAIAFMDQPIFGDDRGTVAIINTRGDRLVTSSEWSGEQGLAWSASGDEVWFTATKTRDYERALYAINRKGKQRLVLRIPGSILLKDIARDGRVLLARHDRRWEVVSGEIGGSSRPFGWLQIMVANAVSRDGKFAVITCFDSSKDYDVYLTKLDGSPPVLLGHGTGNDLSPDNKWVSAILPSDTTKIQLLPTGVGDLKNIGASGFQYRCAFWTSDGTRLIVRASESHRSPRYWVQDLDDSPPRPITPEGLQGTVIRVNQKDYVSVRQTGTPRLYPVDGGQPIKIVGLTDTDEIFAGVQDKEAVYVDKDNEAVPMKIFRLNVRDGHRDNFADISPSDPAGLIALFPPIFAGDNKHYIDSQVRELSVLFVVSGLK